MFNLLENGDMKTLNRIRTVILILFFLMLSIVAKAEGIEQAAGYDVEEADFEPPPPKMGWSYMLSVGPMYMPAFTGSKDYQLVAFPDIEVQYNEQFFASLFKGIGYKFILSEEWQLGPIVKMDFGRDEEVGNPFSLAAKKIDTLKGFGNVDMTPEVGAFAEYSTGPFAYSLEIRQGVGGHKGLIGETGPDIRAFIPRKSGKPIMAMAGIRALFGDSNYTQTFFGVSEKQSTNTGLAKYEPSFGFISVGARMIVIVPMTDSISLGAMGGYDRLIGEAAKSPLIKERGTEDQFMGGFRLNYEW